LVAVALEDVPEAFGMFVLVEPAEPVVMEELMVTDPVLVLEVLELLPPCVILNCEDCARICAVFDALTRLTWKSEPMGRFSVTVRLPEVPSTLLASVCFCKLDCANMTVKVVGSVLTSAHSTTFGPPELHVSP